MPSRVALESRRQKILVRACKANKIEGLNESLDINCRIMSYDNGFSNVDYMGCGSPIHLVVSI